MTGVGVAKRNGADHLPVVADAEVRAHEPGVARQCRLRCRGNTVRVCGQQEGSDKQLTVHATIEEEIFYPALRGISDEIDDLLDEAEVEHQVAKDLIAAIEEDPAGDKLEANYMVLSEYVAHHIEEEEGELFKNAIKEKLTSSPSSAFGCRLTAERTRIPTALRDALRSHFGGFLLRRAA